MTVKVPDEAAAMNLGRIFAQLWPLGMAYAVLTGIAVMFARFDGGLSFVWPAGALVIAALVQSPRRAWPHILGLTFVINVVITGFFGLGWVGAVPISMINGGEMLLAAWMLRRHDGSRELMADLRWFRLFLLAMAVAPLAMAPFAGVLLWALGGDGLGNAFRFVTSHALGNLIVAPIAFYLTGPAAARELGRVLRRRRQNTILVLGLLLLTTLLVFWQTMFPALFLPVMLVVLATFRLGRAGAALGLVIVAAVGGTLTALDHGPMTLIASHGGIRLQFLQFYLATTMLTVLPIAADLNHRRTLHRTLRQSEADFRMLAEHCTDVIMRLRPDGTIHYASPSIASVIGYSAAEVTGRPSGMLIDERDLAQVRGEHGATLEASGEMRAYTYRVRTKSGETRWFSTHARALLDDEGQPVELLAIIRDVTALKQDEKAWVEAALTDPLTGIANRRALQRVSAARREEVPAGTDCLALFDLDRFKSVNDTFGHDAGDAVLKGFATLMENIVRTSDVVARLGGEEFVVLFRNMTVEQAFEVCERIRLTLSSTPLPTPVGALRITVSGGVAVLGGEGLDWALKSADRALYRAKQGGRDRLLLAA